MKRSRWQNRMASLFVPVLLTLGATAAHAAIPVSERTALLDLYTSTNGAGWTTQTNWNGAVGTECTWFGVTCSVFGTSVVGIVLVSNNLTGTIPALNGLTDLQIFNVGTNHLTGTIPALSALTDLRLFNVGENQLTGTIPALTGLTNLLVFDVGKNQLTGTIPALTGLPSLRSFTLSNNQLTGTIPALTGLTDLQVFDVGMNHLTGAIPALTGPTDLRVFDVGENQLTGTIPALTALTSLQSFTVSNNLLTGTIPALTGMTSLQALDVDGNKLTGNVPSVPSPNGLKAGLSRLCPNYLNHTHDPAWDAATGQKSWYLKCVAFPDCYTLVLDTSPTGVGSVTVNTALNCGGGYQAGTSVSLTANAPSYYTFSGWSGNGGSFSNPSANATRFSITGNARVTASFLAGGDGGGSCSTGAILPLVGGRFVATLNYVGYGSNPPSGAGTGHSLSDNVGYFGTVDPASLDILVKIVDFCSLNGTWSVYIGGTTDVNTVVSITDTATGIVSQPFVNPLGQPFQLIRSAEFLCSPGVVKSPEVIAPVSQGSGGECSGTLTEAALPLVGGRFVATLVYAGYGANPPRGTGTGHLLTDNVGYFGTVDPTSADVAVKMIDFCSLNGTWSVYIGGTTDINTTISITDTATGLNSQPFVNPLGQGFQLIRSQVFTCP